MLQRISEYWSNKNLIMKRASFKVAELNLKNDSEEEQVRTRKIFEELKERVKNGQQLSEHEKDFFCMGVRLSLLNDGQIEDYTCCGNYEFKFLYLIYFHDLKGGSAFYKPQGTSLTRVEPREEQKDLAYLYNEAEEWEKLIQKTNHSEQLLQQLSAETRNELKNLDKQPEFSNNQFARGSFRYDYKKQAILLHSKYIYCMALEIFETYNQEDLILNINGQTIEFNEYSLVHILNRHYSELTKQYSTGKTFHNEDFMPRILSIQLKEILKIIDASKILNGKPIDKIGFQMKGIDYLLWSSEETKSLKGQGNIKYRRLNTFYPVTDDVEIEKIKTENVLKKISDEISVYVPK